MTDEIVLSKHYDAKLEKNPSKEDINKSIIWTDACKPTSDEVENPKEYYRYHIRFNGLTPIQILKIVKPH